MSTKIHLVNGNISLINGIYNTKTNDVNYIANNEQELKEIINGLNDDKYSIVYYSHNDNNRLVYSETQFVNTKLRLNKNYCKPKSNICVVVKIDNSLLSDFEKLCLNQIYNSYHNRDIFILTSNENDTKDLSNTFANNIIYYETDCIIDNDINFYKLFQDYGYEWMLYISNLNVYVYQDSLDEFTNLGYDTFGASIEPFFNKKLVHAYDTTYNLRKIETHKQLCSILSNEEKNNYLINNVYRHINLFSMPPKELQYIFAVKNFPEQQYDIYQKLPLAAINPFDYINEYNYEDGYQFDNELYIEFENDHSFYKKHNIDNWATQNTYYNDINLDKFKKQSYEELIRNFMHNSTFPDFEKINSLLKTAENDNKIPKLVHFCFLGWNDLPEKNKICILSWIEKLENNGYMFINWTPALLEMKSNA